MSLLGELMDRLKLVFEAPSSSDGPPSSLWHREVPSFGSNPGNLRMHLRLPGRSTKRRPLVVALHGCTQTAEGFDEASGWSRLGARDGFLVLLPEQRPSNNEKTCFSWFQPGDTRRGQGEVESIRQMIDKTIADYDVNRENVFICGLSAGGAMACAMLATYPELFAGGAIIAGLPYGAATNTSEALDIMFRGRIKEAKVWGDAVRAASDYTGPWPTISIWHGTADTVVKPINAGELVKQWTHVHGVTAGIPAEDHIGKVTRRVWFDKANKICVRDYTVPELAHGVPIDLTESPAPFFLPAGISSTQVIARDWELAATSLNEYARALLRRPA